MDNDDVGKAHFNLDDLLIDKNKKSKKKNRKELEADKEKKTDDFELNVNDPRFNAIFYDHKFNIDPSDQSFKKTKAMENLLDEKSKRKFNEIDDDETSDGKQLDDSNKTAKLDASALLLVKSIKSRNEVIERKKLQTKEKQRALRNKLRILK